MLKICFLLKLISCVQPVKCFKSSTVKKKYPLHCWKMFETVDKVLEPNAAHNTPRFIKKLPVRKNIFVSTHLAE